MNDRNVLIKLLRMKFESRSDLAKRENALHRKLFKNHKDVLDEALPNRRNHHTLGSCKESALKYKTRNEWAVRNGGSYNAARKNKWLDQCCKHMTILPTIWNLKSCLLEAKKFKTRKEWGTHSSGSYNAARKNKWLDQCCKHMTKMRKLYTLDILLLEAKKFKTRNEWKTQSSNSYSAAFRNGWLDECCNHMIMAHRSYTLASCLREAKKFKTRGDWSAQDPNSYAVANRNGWLEQCCKHMPKNLSLRSIRCVETNVIYESANEAARALGRDKLDIWGAIKNNTKAGGYHWAYCDEDGNIIK